MNGIANYFALVAKSKTGLGPDVIVWGLVALIGAAAAVIFLVIAGFIVLADAYSPLTAALVMAGAFLLVAILAAILCLTAQRRIAERSRVALAARTSALWFEPKLLAAGVELVRSIGLRRLVPLAAIGVLAGGLAREWIMSDRPPEDPAGEDSDG
jgi:hypothetical protein